MLVISLATNTKNIMVGIGASKAKKSEISLVLLYYGFLARWFDDFSKSKMIVRL